MAEINLIDIMAMTPPEGLTKTQLKRWRQRKAAQAYGYDSADGILTALVHGEAAIVRLPVDHRSGNHRGRRGMGKNSRARNASQQ